MGILVWLFLFYLTLGVPLIVSFLKSAKSVLQVGYVLCGINIALTVLIGLGITQSFPGGGGAFAVIAILLIPVLLVTLVHLHLIRVRARDLKTVSVGTLTCECGYDLHGSLDSHVCPECGRPTPWAHHLTQG